MTANKLKLIAITTMLIDHIAAMFLWGDSSYFILRMIGRIAFPIFAFLIAEGYVRTRDVKKYAIRLLIFAFISEIPFNLAFGNKIFYLGHQNVFFTLFLGLLAIISYNYFNYEYREPILGFFSVVAIGYLAALLNTDYGLFGVAMIFIFYVYRNNFRAIAIVIAIINIYMWGLQPFAIMALPLIYLYNNQKGKQLKYLFYVFYPAHLFILWLIEYYVF